MGPVVNKHLIYYLELCRCCLTAFHLATVKKNQCRDCLKKRSFLFTCLCVLSGSIRDSSKDLFFLSRLPDLISFEEVRVMLCAFSGNFNATMDMLRERRRPNLRVRNDIDPLNPRLRGSGAGALSSTLTPSSLAPAISLCFNTKYSTTSTITSPTTPSHETDTKTLEKVLR